MMNCIEATRRMSDALDRPLRFRERVELQMHLMMCSGCRNYRLHMGFIRQACKGYASGDGDAFLQKDDGQPDEK